MKILAAYIREKSYVKKNTVTEDYEQQEKDKSLSTDIQVILDLICKRKRSFNEQLDLRNSNLRDAQLSKAHLDGGVILLEAYIKEAILSGAGANLGKARLLEDFLEILRLRGVHLEGAYLSGVHLERAELSMAHLEGAIRFRCKKSGYFTKPVKNITNGIFICHKPVNNDTKSNSYSLKRQ